MPEYAGAGSRIVAVIIDHIILAIVMLLVTMPLGLSTPLFSNIGNVASMMAIWANMTLFAIASVINIVLMLLYFSYFESTSGQTLGKKVMGIKVAKDGGDKVTFGDALIRTILRIIDGLGAYLLGLIVILVSEKKQRIGDMAANTIVVKA